MKIIGYFTEFYLQLKGKSMGPISVLIKPASGCCNLRCVYCFYRSLSEKLSSPASIMKKETAEALIQRVFAENPSEITFAFQGGEPTLAGISFFRDFCHLAENVNFRGIPLRWLIQTNGLLLDREFCEFLAEKHFLVGLSIDGTRQLHDALRPSASGKGSYASALAASRHLQAAGCDFNLLTVISAQLAGHPDAVWNSYLKEGFGYLQFIPCVDDFGCKEGKGYAPSPRRLGEFWARIFELWASELLKGRYVSVRWFDNLIHIALQQQPEMCGLQGFCTGQLVIESDGSVYPCDFFADESWKLGNILEDSISSLLASERMSSFRKSSFTHPKECEDCVWRYFCRGGCRRDKVSFPNDSPGYNRLCEAYRVFFPTFARLLPSILKKLEEEGVAPPENRRS